MAPTWRTVRVFISSTFRDMHAERDHLVRVVFPELKERCRKRQVQLIDVDLRWGVTEEQAEHGGALDICLDEIDSCRPYFLGLLGHRYGCIPPGHDHSITAQEVYHGVLHNNLPRQLIDLRPFVEGILEGRTLFKEQVSSLVRCYPWDPEKGKYLLQKDITPEDQETLRSIFDVYSIYQKDRSFFFFRSESLTRELAGSRIEDYFEADEALKGRLAMLKREIIAGGLPCFEYDDLETFGQKVLETLWGRIDAEFPEDREEIERDWLEEEAEFHELFMADRTRRFVGRSDIIKTMQTFVEEDSDPRLMVITGEPGCGKSALMARFTEEAIHHHPDWLVLSHFVGASPSSTSLRRTLRRLCTQLNRALGVEGEAPEDYKELAQLFPELLQRASETRRTLLIIDALNQFERTDSAHTMRWLTQKLPQNVKVVASTLAGEVLDALEARRIQPRFEELTGLTEPEIKEFVTSYLGEIRKEFPTRQIQEAFYDKIRAGHPLYIFVALEELRVFPVYEGLEKRVASLPDTVPELFDQVLERVEGDFTRLLVQDFMSFVACGRQGMTGEELQTLLRVYGPTFDRDKLPGKLPDMLFSRLRRAFSAYLFERSGVIDFFHGQLTEAVGKRYLAEEVNRDKTHHIIANYFEMRWPELYLRALDELPHQLTKAKDWDGLDRVLCDLHFIEAKCANGMTYDLIHDYSVALDALPEAQEEKQERLKHEARVKKYTEDLIAYAKGEIEQLDIIPSVEPWSDERIRQDTERIINSPTRWDKVRAFSQFVNSESRALVKFAYNPSFVIQQAYNSASSGPIANQADEIINTRVNDILLLQKPFQRPDYNPHPALIRILEGHVDFCSVSMTPDGKRAISGSADKTLRVWDLESGVCLRILYGHTDGINSVSMTPDGRKAVSGSLDMTVRVWDLEKGECLRTLKGHTGWIMGSTNSVSILPNGRRAVSGGSDKKVRMWNLETGVCSKSLKGHTGWFESFMICVGVTADGNIAVSASGDKTLRVWNLDSGVCLGVLRGHTAWIMSVSVTPDGNMAATGSVDGALRVWDLKSGKCIRTFVGSTSMPGSVSITADGSRVLSGSWDGALRIWNIEGGCQAVSFDAHSNLVTTVSMTTDERLAVSGSYDRTLRVWDMESGKCLRTLKGHTSRVENVRTTQDGKRVVSGSWDKNPCVWDLESGRHVRSLKGNRGSSFGIGVTPDGKGAISGSGKRVPEGFRWLLYVPKPDNSMRMWDLESGQCLRILKGHTDTVAGVSFTPDGSLAVSGSWDKTLRVWNLKNSKCLMILQGHADSVYGVNVTPDGKRAVSGSKDMTLRVWNLKSRECIRTLKGHTGAIMGLSVTADAQRVVSTSMDGTLRLWELESGECLAVYGAPNELCSISEITASGHFALGRHDGKVVLITSHSFPMGLPIETSVRMWVYGRLGAWLFKNKRHSSIWDEHISALCQWCGERFTVSDKILDVIRVINCDANLSPDQSPCLELPAEAWKEPRLLSECPLCHKPLKFNPFVVDNRGRY